MQAPQIDAPVIFTPNLGGQMEAMRCPVYEMLMEGNRGGGKTDALLWKFAKYTGRGFGPAWRGVIFARKMKPQLEDIVARSQKWFRRCFPEARWLASKSDYKWVWPDGEELLFRVMENEEQYWDYHGHEYPFIGWEELTRYADPGCYDVMKSCSRSSTPGMPRFYISNTNPYGAGFGWVKERFIDPMPRGIPLLDGHGNARITIHMNRQDNRPLMEADPDYERKLTSDGNIERMKAWVYGDWNINVGGYFEGAWEPERNILDPFIPGLDWPRWRAMDWGYAAPYSVGWYTIDPEGVTIRYRELYGYGGKANKGTREEAPAVAANILKIEQLETRAGLKFNRNPADSAIWAKDGRERSINDYFREKGVYWLPSQKGPGSIARGAQIMAEKMRNGTFKVTSDCQHWLRTVPTLMPDENDLESIDREQENHAFDESRYSLVSRHKMPKAGKQKAPERNKIGPRNTYDDIYEEEPKRSRYRR